MKGLKIPMVMLLLIMVAMPMMRSGADVDITLTTDGDVDLAVLTGGDGALLSVDYNGRDLLNEIKQKIKTIEGLRTIIAYYSARTDVEDLQKEIEKLDADLVVLVSELNHVFNDLYAKVNSQAHIIGINPANNSIAMTLIAGNSTVSDYIHDAFVEIDEIDTELVSLQYQVDVFGSEARATESALQSLAGNFNDALAEIWSTDRKLDSRIDVLSMSTEELRDELISLDMEFRMLRNSTNYISIIFGVFSVIAIGIVAMTRRP